MKTWLIALGLVLLQVATAMVFSDRNAANLGIAYTRLCQWDSHHYRDIVERGYAGYGMAAPASQYVPEPPPGKTKDNASFFPGYPLIARFLHIELGINSEVALLLVAQTAAVIFWAVFLRLLQHWRVQARYQALAVGGIFAHPCSFYLVMGYAESLFCATLVLIVYFSLGRSPRTELGWAVSGFVLSSTRIMGIPMAGLAGLNWLFRKRPSLIKSLLIGAFSALGAGLFFVYCKIHFGEFDHYMKNQKAGWEVVPDYLAVFKANNYDLTGNDDWKAMSWTPAILLLTALVEFIAFRGFRDSPKFRRGGLWRIRLPWYLGALALWYLSAAGVAAVSFRSLIRYSLPWTILLIIGWAHLFSYSVRLPKAGKATALLVLAILLALLYSRKTLIFQDTYLYGGWVS